MLIKVGVHGEPFYLVSISSSGYWDSLAQLPLQRLAEIIVTTTTDARYTALQAAAPLPPLQRLTAVVDSLI